MLLISLAQSNVFVDWTQALLGARPWTDVRVMSNHLTQIIQRLRHMKLDVTEYTCLKALVLFRPGNTVIMYRVAHNKPDYLLCYSIRYFYNKTHNYYNVRAALWAY